MAKKGVRAGKSYKDQYKSYRLQDRENKNRIKKLQKVVRSQPENMQAIKALDRALLNKKPHTAGRRGLGHVCKGLHKQLGFIKNKPNEHMKLTMHWYMGEHFDFKQNKDVKAMLNKHGDSAAYQFRILGIK